MDERLYSRPLDVHRLSDYPEVQRMITYLFDEMKSSGLIGKSPRKKILKHLKVVVLDGIAMEWQTITLSRNEKCPACQDRPAYSE